jgi:hypothetical protein
MRKIVEKHNVYAGQKYEMFYLVIVQMKRVWINLKSIHNL